MFLEVTISRQHDLSTDFILIPQVHQKQMQELHKLIRTLHKS